HRGMRQAQRIAIDHGWTRRAWLLPWALLALHHFNFHAEEEIDMWRRAAAVVDRDADPEAFAVVNCQLGKAMVLHGDPATAAEHVDLALSVPSKFVSNAVLSGVGSILSVIAQRLGDTETVLPKITAVVERLAAKGSTGSLASALNAKAMVHVEVGDAVEA